MRDLRGHNARHRGNSIVRPDDSWPDLQRPLRRACRSHLINRISKSVARAASSDPVRRLRALVYKSRRALLASLLAPFQTANKHAAIPADAIVAGTTSRVT